MVRTLTRTVFVSPPETLDDVRRGDPARRLDDVACQLSERPPARTGSLAQQGERVVHRELVAFCEDPVRAFDDDSRVECGLELPDGCLELGELLCLDEGLEGQPLDLLARGARARMAVGAVTVWAQVVSFAPLRLCA
jgi:hypothetical protein